MLAEIEDAVVELVEGLGLPVRDVDLKELQRGNVARAAGVVSIEDATFRKQGQSVFRCEPTIVIVILFRQLKGDRDRRKGLYPLLEGVQSRLALETLNLGIDPLVPARWRNVTDEELASYGIKAYQIEFRTGFAMRKPADDEAEELIRIGLDYFLPADDTAPSAQDLVILREEEGQEGEEP